MFAVIRTGGKQYRVAAEDVIKVEKVKGDPGEIVQFGEVLVVGGDDVTLGVPTIAGASVAAEVLEQGRGAKVIAFKKRRRKNSRRKRGHRQEFTLLRVTEILTDGAKPTVTARPKPEPKPKPVVTRARRRRRARREPGAEGQGRQEAEAGRKKADKKPAKKAERRRTSRNRAPRARRSDDFVTKLDYITGDERPDVQGPATMAHKKAGGSSRNGRDSNSQRLGLKIFGGEQVLAGNIIARQRGTKWHPGTNVGLGKDHTLFALTHGRVEFRTKAKGRIFVSVLPMTEAAAE